MIIQIISTIAYLISLILIFDRFRKIMHILDIMADTQKLFCERINKVEKDLKRQNNEQVNN